MGALRDVGNTTTTTTTRRSFNNIKTTTTNNNNAQQQQQQEQDNSVASTTTNNTSTGATTTAVSSGRGEIRKALQEIMNDIERRVAAKQSKPDICVKTTENFIFSYIYGLNPQHVFIFNKKSSRRLVSVALL